MAYDRLTRLAHVLFVTSLVLVIVVFGISRFQVSEEVALYAVALALAMIPEALLAIVTITLSKGVSQMHRRRAVIRRLDAIETIGGVRDICLDKTGTLTTGNMAVRKVWSGRSIWVCTGGDNSFSGVEMELISGVKGGAERVVRCASLCNNATVKQTVDGWQAYGDPTEVHLQNIAADHV